jgi:hypothetical protein
VRRTTIPCIPPDGSVSLVTDVVATLNKFRNLTGAPLKEPSLLDLKINITDVTHAVGAFTGEGYPVEPIGDPCGG